MSPARICPIAKCGNVIQTSQRYCTRHDTLWRRRHDAEAEQAMAKKRMLERLREERESRGPGCAP